MAKPATIKTERPEDLASPHKGPSKTRRKMNDAKEEDPQAPTIKVTRRSALPPLAHPSTLIDCKEYVTRSKSWKEDGMKVTLVMLLIGV